MSDALGVLLVMVIGLVLAVFSRSLARYTADFYYRLTGVEYSEKLYQVLYLGIGILLFVYCLLGAVRMMTGSL